MKKTLFFLSSFILLCSCNTINTILQERPHCFKTKNVYKELDMAVFKGFVDNISLQELIKVHGNPDTILDAWDVAMIENYIIYEYNIPEGAIDCYIKKNTDRTKVLIDHIYFEPKNNIKLSDFIKNDSLQKLIQSKNSVVFYIGDDFNNIVRFRLEQNNNQEIVNVALNDITLLDEKKKISTYVQEISSNVPIELGDFGSINEIKFEKDEIQLSFIVSENSEIDVLKIVNENPNWDLTLISRVFGKFGLIKGMATDIIREKVNLKLCLKGEKSGKETESTISSNTFVELFENGISNLGLLSNIVSFENLTLPQRVNEWLTLGKIKAEDCFLVLDFSLDGTQEDYVVDVSTIKEHEISLLSDEENPDRDYISICARCGFGIKKVYHIGNNKKNFEVVYSPEEVKALLLKI